VGFTVDIRDVSRFRRRKAVRFLLAGRAGGSDLDARGRRFLADTIGPAARNGYFMLAESGGELSAVALISKTCGGTGMLFYSGPDLPGVQPDALAEVIGAISRKAVAAGASYVQCLLAPEKEPLDGGILCDAGLKHVAALQQMKLSLDAAASPTGASAEVLQWTTVSRIGLDRLGPLIKLTYKHSLDCPALLDCRPIGSVIAGHKTSGRYRPDLWMIASSQGRDVGCVLINQTNTACSGEIVYMGVADGFRGRGVGRALLARAVGQARLQGFQTLSLAVDEANKPAEKLYKQAGFKPISRRMIYAMKPDDDM
jgi:GNAT superfamily N-acetyltransferase